MSIVRQRGFSLPEVLVALLIFALIASAAVYTLRLGVNSRIQLKEADGALKELQLARMIIKEDMAQLVKRRVRDEFGDAAPASFQGGDGVIRGQINFDEKILVAFTRGGWINPRASAPRSTLQYVEYIYRQRRLIRRSRPYLDHAPGAAHYDRVLFEGISNAVFEYADGDADGEVNWISAWPATLSDAPPPKAIRLTIEQEASAPLRMLFWTGAGP